MRRVCMATYYFDTLEVDVYGCADELTEKNTYEFFEIEVEGDCVSEGSLFSEVPSREVVGEFLKTNGGEEYAKLVM